MADELDDKIITRLTKHIDDAMLRSHKSKDRELSGLMADLRKRLDTVVTDMQTVNENIQKLSHDVEGFNNELEKVEVRLQNNLDKHELTSKANHHDHERRLSFTEKAMMAAGGAILLSVLYAILGQIGL